MDSKHQVIECADFLSMRLLNQVPLCNQIEHLFLNKAKAILRAYPFSFDVKFLDVAAMDTIVSGKRIFENVDECDENEERVRRKKIEKSQLYRLADRYRNMQEEVILILRMRNLNDAVEQCDVSDSPSDSHFPDAFRKVFPNITDSSARRTVKTVDINDYETLKQTVSEFTVSSASKAMRLVIALSKPIQRDRLVISESISLPFQSFLDYVVSCFTEHFHAQILPIEVDIAYTQLDSMNRFGTPSDARVNVISVSGSDSQDGLSMTHFEVLVDGQDSRSKRYQFSSPVSRAGKPKATLQSASYLKPKQPKEPSLNSVFQSAHYVESSSPSSSGLFSTESSEVPTATRTWSVEEFGYDTTD